MAAHITKERTTREPGMGQHIVETVALRVIFMSYLFSSIRHWHQSDWLPRFPRACPSTALDKYQRSMPRPAPPSRRKAPAYFLPNSGSASSAAPEDD